MNGKRHEKNYVSTKVGEDPTRSVRRPVMAGVSRTGEVEDDEEDAIQEATNLTGRCLLRSRANVARTRPVEDPPALLRRHRTLGTSIHEGPSGEE